jgi:DNA invertase Pin-like site-specific DNA recombinase
MSRTKRPRTVALCYVRQSYTRDSDDQNSPTRQRANIDALVQARGWVAEWYEDVGGHKSGRTVKSRPQWLALKQRIGDPDVVALVANDMSRLHRKGWRIGHLIETLNQNDVALVFAAPGRELDTSTMAGRMTAQFLAMIDEAYAEDIAQRATDSIMYRKQRGITVGIPPFGTVRDNEGYLIPIEEGAWYLPDGTFQPGDPSTPPHEHAIWRNYFDCAGYIFELYATGNMGLEKIAYKLTAEGWPYRTRKGTPRRFNREDVRRVIANWPEYGGIVSDTRSKDRAGYEDIDLDEIPFKPERALFPIELLAKVARTRQQRSIEPKDMGVKRKSVPYPLSVMTYCAHCERLAIERDDMSLRSKLYGYTGPDDIKRYRHKAGINCGCTNRSVHTEVYERDFHRLVELLDVDAEHLDSMTNMALELDRVLGIEYDTLDLEEKKREAIALCRKKIDAAVVLFGEGRIELADYQRRIEENEREIRYWEAKTSEVEKINVELSMALDIVQHMAQLWHTSSPEDRKGMAQNLFDSLTYDLDTQRITAFRLKPWADRFMVLRAQLYEGFDVRQVNWRDFKGSSNHMPPREQLPFPGYFESHFTLSA